MSDSMSKLVSVVVVSYNAADSIVGTLDSIYRQTYQDIELIIADDASKDNTVEVAQEWIASHRERFVDCVLLAHEKNHGVVGNMNSGIQVATGYYIKMLAADDRLQPRYMEVHVDYLNERGVDCVCSHMRAFRIESGRAVYFDFYPPAGPDFFDSDAQTQYRMLLGINRIYTPTLLATRKLYDRHGLFDTRFPFIEDYPFYLKLTREGTKMNFLDVCLVDYCYSETSLSNATSTRILHPDFHKTMRKLFYKERLPGLLRCGIFKYILLSFWQLFFGDCVLLFGNSREKPLARLCDDLRTLEFLRSKKKSLSR